MAGWATVAHRLGLRLALGHDVAVLYGMRGDVILSVTVVSPGFTVDAYVTGGHDRAALHRQILDDEPLRRAFSAHCGRELSGEFVRIDHESASLVVLPVKESPPAWRFDHASNLIVAFSHVVERAAPPAVTGCRFCGCAEGARLQLVDGVPRFSCSPCRTRVEEEKTSGAEEQEAQPEMDSSEIDPRVFLAQQQRLKVCYEKNRDGYRRRLLAWTLLGQVGFLLISLGVLALVAGLGFLGALALSSGLWAVAVKLLVTVKPLILLVALKAAKLAIAALIALACFAWVMVKGIWSLVRGLLWKKPSSHVEEYRIPRSELPRFFTWLDALAAQVEAPPVDALVIDRGVNAAVTEERYGWQRYRRIIVLGLPVLEFFDVSQLEAIVGHELGHLRHGDVRSLWVYRTCQMYLDAWKALGRAGTEGELIRKFLRWYVPTFLMRAQVVQREQEVAADARAAELAGTETMARSLVKANVLGRLYAKAQLDMVKACARESPRVPDYPVAACRVALQRMPEDQWRRAFSASLEEEPHWLDSHPVLQERLHRLRFEVPESDEGEWMSLDPARPGATLVDDWPRHRAKVVGDIRGDLEPLLQKAHRFYQRTARRDEALGRHLEDCPESVPLLVERARAKKELEEWPPSEALYRRALELSPEHVDARIELCHVYSELEKWDDAAREAEMVLERTPGDNLDLDLAMAPIFEKVGRHERSLELYRRVLRAEMPVAVRAVLETRVQALETRASLE